MTAATYPLTRFAIDYTAELIRIDTTADTPGEVAGLESVAHQFRDRDDFRITWARTSDGEQRALLIAPAEPTGAVLLFSGHIDTVRANPEGWRHDPWSGVIDADGWLHGRGASDMKSGLAAQIAAVLHSPRGSQVALAVSRNEENGCKGTDDVLQIIRSSGIRVGAIVVAEPTGGEIVLGHKGPFWIDVTTSGVAAHGSTPQLGVSAIQKLTTLLQRASTELPLRTHPELGVETVNVGTIRGGAMRNIVPDHAVAEIDIRAVEADVEPLASWWRSQPEVDTVTVDVQLPALWTDSRDAWVRSLPGTLAASPVGFGTEAGPLAAHLAVTRAVIWGPGPMDRMHVRDERVRVADIERAAVDFAAVVADWPRWQTA